MHSWLRQFSDDNLAKICQSLTAIFHISRWDRKFSIVFINQNETYQNYLRKIEYFIDCATQWKEYFRYGWSVVYILRFHINTLKKFRTIYLSSLIKTRIMQAFTVAVLAAIVAVAVASNYGCPHPNEAWVKYSVYNIFFEKVVASFLEFTLIVDAEFLLR